jgi:hypothetical protein
VAEAIALQVVVGDFADEPDPQRFEGQIPPGVPAALGSRYPPSWLVLTGLPPRPRVLVAGFDAIRGQLVDELEAAGVGERRRHADVVQHPLVVVEAEQERPDLAPVLVPPEATDSAVGGALVLHLGPAPLAFGVGAGEVFRDDAVEAGALEAREPVARHLGGLRRRREVNGRR